MKGFGQGNNLLREAWRQDVIEHLQYEMDLDVELLSVHFGLQFDSLTVVTPWGN